MIGNIEKMTLDEFIDFVDESCDEQRQEMVNARSIFYSLIDLYGEARKLAISDDAETTLKQLESCHKLFNLIRHHKDCTDGMRYELKITEWSLYDFYLGKNQFHNNKKSIMSWFNQWYVGFNFALLNV